MNAEVLEQLRDAEANAAAHNTYDDRNTDDEPAEAVEHASVHVLPPRLDRVGDLFHALPHQAYRVFL